MKIMSIATATFDSSGPRGTLRARIPEPLSEDERRAKYDDPLSRRMAEEAVEGTVRGFCIPPVADHPTASVEIEVEVAEPDRIVLVPQIIADLGAPPATIIEIETEKASIEFTLEDKETE